jgi:hypothetical protein
MKFPKGYPIPCFDCDQGTSNRSMFWVGEIAGKLIYQCEKCKTIEIREYKGDE